MNPHLLATITAEARFARTGGTAAAYTWGPNSALVQAFRSDDDWQEARAGNLDAPAMTPTGSVADADDRTDFRTITYR